MTCRKLWNCLFATLCLSCADKVERPADAPRLVRIYQVKPAGAAAGAVFSGSTQARTRSALSFKIGGQIKSIRVKVGQKVKKGQLIAELDAADLRVRLRQAQAAYVQARAQAQNAEALYRRQQRLFENQGISIQQLDDSRTNAQSTRANVAAQSQAVALAKSQLAYCRLTAPGAGTIAEVPANTGENTTAGRTVAVLNSEGKPEVEIVVAEAMINDIKVGRPAKVSLGALSGREYAAQVSEVGVSAQSTGYPVTLVFTGEDTEAIRAGMSAEVRLDLPTSATATALMVPAEAVLEDQKGRFVFLANGAAGSVGQIERRDVDVGKLRERGLEVLKGLQAGDQVVIAGLHFIEAKMPVRIPK